MQLELLGQGLAQRHVVVDDQYLATRAHRRLDHPVSARATPPALFATAPFTIPAPLYHPRMAAC